MLKIFKKRISKKWTAFLVVVLGLFWKVKSVKAVGVLGVGAIAYAASEVISWFFGTSLTGMTLAAVLGGIIFILMQLVGGILTVLIWILFQAAKYTNFINEPIVSQGWVVVRDLCNMFFILILLVIAFATILRQDNYSAKKLLPKLLIMAVLINFSKTICGLAIDFAQVIMLTFVNAFGSAGSGNIITTFGVDKLYSLSNITKTAVDQLSTTSSLLLGLVMLVITTIVVGIFTIVLVFRIIMLWILIILSPLAFLAMAIPAGAKYASQWMDEFTKHVIVGPIMAFFLWLALLYGSTTSNVDIGVNLSNTGDSKVPAATLSAIGEGNNMQRFIIATCLLVGSLMIAQQIGAAGGSLAGSAVGKIKTVGAGAALLPLRGTRKVASFGLDKLSHAVGVDLNVVRGFKRIGAQMEENRQVREVGVYKKAAEHAKEGKGMLGGRIAMLSTGDIAWQNIVNWNKGRNLKRFVLGKKRTEDKLSGELGSLEAEREGVTTTDILRQNEDKQKNYVEVLRNYNRDIQTAEQNNKPEEAENLRVKRDKTEQEYLQWRDAVYNPEKLKNMDDEKAKALDNQIKDKREERDSYRLISADTAIAASSAELENQQAKKIAHLDNADDLGRILAEAIRTQNEGLIAATSKKMAKMGDYNEMQGQLKLGTGTKGMHDLAKLFEQKGGMTQQSARSLISEIGGICKNINHFGGYAAMRMVNGRWEEASEEQAQQAQLAEMLKIQPQEYARKVNRLGLGSYDEKGNWQISKAAVAYFKLNGSALAKEYGSTGQQNALEHIMKDIRVLEDKNNQIDKQLIETIKTRTATGGGKGMDVKQQIAEVRIPNNNS